MKIQKYVSDFKVTIDDGKFFYVSNDGVSFYKSEEYYNNIEPEMYNDRFLYKDSFALLDEELEKYRTLTPNVWIDECIKMIENFRKR